MSPQVRRHQRLARTCALLLLTVLGAVLAVATPALAVSAPALAAPSAPSGASTTGTKPAPVILIATTGLTWGDLIAEHTAPLDGGPTPDPQDVTETLLSLTWATTPANLVQRTASATTCPADAWLSLSAGARTRALPSSDGTDCGWPTDWNDAVAASQQAGYGAQPGALADALAQAGLSTLAVGRGASLMLTTSDGDAPASVRSFEQAVSFNRLADLTVVDATEPHVLIESLRLASALDDARVVVASIADPTDPGLQALVLPKGTTGWRGTGAVPADAVVRADDALLVTSPSTRQPGLVQLTDLSPTLLTALGVEVPTSMTGQALALPTTSPAVELKPLDSRHAPLGVLPLARDALHAEASQMTTLPVGGALVLASLACLVVAAVVLRGPAGPRRLRAVGITATCVAALPAGAWLGATIPWWHAGTSTAYEPGRQVVPAALAATIVMALCLLALLHGASAAVTALHARTLLRAQAPSASEAWRLGRLVQPHSFWEPTAPQLTVVLLAATIAVVLFADGAAGAPLGFNGVLGMDAVVAGRFYGLSNTAFALGAAALVVALGAVAGPLVAVQPSPALRRTAAFVGVGVPGVVALIVVGLPSLGADVGGALTLVAAFAALAAGLAGGRITWRQWLGVGVGAVTVVGAFGLADHVTGSGTHMGRFVGQLQDGTAATTVRRKAWALVAPFASSPLALVALVLAVVAVAGAWWWLARERWAWRAGVSGYAPLVASMSTAVDSAQDRSEGRVGDAADGGQVGGPDGSDGPNGGRVDGSVDGLGGREVTQGLVPRWFVPVLRALLVLVVVEVLVNDSGASMAVLSATCAAPLLLALGCARLRPRTR
ncbi:hypothetical protein [Actinomyces respiraculi]|uniref:hypothetical protein n=1 Tax=Actinomyces respiraculi TaxID=2744574 RepID=UPI0014208A2E|nr:hypothetical protein [Actinomyces respiraculi]